MSGKQHVLSNVPVLALATARRVAADEEICYAYNRLANNNKLLRHYGFVLPNNPMDFLELSFDPFGDVSV